MADGDLWRDRNKVFVAGLPHHVDDDALYEKFKPFGEMHQSKVVYDQKTGRSRGFGFVTFCEYTNALDAVDQLNQSKWDKRTLNVRFLQPKNGATGAAATAPSRPTKVIGPRPEGCTTIYVGNLAYDITEEVLRKVFDKCGSIRAVRFAEHIQTKEFRGFGYVQFHEEGPCEAAVKLDGIVVMGRPMNIDYGARDEGYAQAREELQKKLKKGICHKFQQGQCTRGDACKFAHVMQDQDAEELVQPAERPMNGIATPGSSLGAAESEPSKPKFEQTQATSDAPVCINFQKGKCKRGAACKFQHLLGNDNSEESVTEENDNVKEEVKAEEEEVPEEEETQAEEGAPVCQNYQKGKCKRGSACRFRHVAAPAGGYQEPEEKGWKAPVRVTLPVAAVAEVAVCRNFQNGRCMRGASCRFAHAGQVAEAAPATAVEEVSEYQKRFQSICYNWQRSGSCVRGDNCAFQHEGGATASEVQKPKASKQEKKHKKHEVEEEVEEDDNAKKHKKHKKDKKDKKRKTAEDVEEDDEESRKTHKKHKKEKTHKKHKKSKGNEDSD
ncbi:unnamed protein product [Phytophthora lilii]|uniref:Unnamed protein product n=1 Tax=Phytophthora lilii TaxID=2077276 RepID=A0A9W6TNF9_9STRA|nr:unnamed protein product [Phytophthora lilii]